jgi:hypothetical protein
MTVIFTNVGLAFVVACALLWFGSVASALAYLGGDRLLVDARSKSFGPVERGRTASVVFRFANASKSPITLMGVSSSCACAFAEGLPGTIGPGAERRVKVAIQTQNKVGRVTEKLRFYSDRPGQSEIDVTVAGYVVNSDHPATPPGLIPGGGR